jgi:hypothetical protein
MRSHWWINVQFGNFGVYTPLLNQPRRNLSYFSQCGWKQTPTPHNKALHQCLIVVFFSHITRPRIFNSYIQNICQIEDNILECTEERIIDSLTCTKDSLADQN